MKWTTLLFHSLLGTLLTPTTAQDPTDLEVQVGQHVIYTYPGSEPPSHLFDLITAGKVGGIAISEENTSDDLPALVERFQSTYQESPAYLGTPLLILATQEGGKTRTFPDVQPELPAQEVGESDDPAGLAATSGEEAAQALQKYGINTNLAPVLDVYRNESGFMAQQGRSYSDDSEVVSGCTSGFITKQQEAGVLGTAKYFPGLGRAKGGEDPYKERVYLGIPQEEMYAVDLAPYMAAIEAGVALVMPSWATYPTFDARKPAGLSYRWVTEELRGNLGFKGAVISDGIGVESLRGAFGGLENQAVAAMQAGVDFILADQGVSQGEKVVAGLVASVGSGLISQETLDNSTARVQSTRGLITV